jgi:hypothetical protein
MVSYCVLTPFKTSKLRIPLSNTFDEVENVDDQITFTRACSVSSFT